MAKKKVLLMGKAHSGKTSMRSIIFANYLARDTTRLSPTLDVEHHHVRFLGDLVLNLWDCGGQDAFYESYFERDRETIFRSVELLIYVFDIESESPEKDFDHFCGVLEAIEENSPDARIFVLVHKMDLVAEEDRDAIFEDRKRLIAESCISCGVEHFKCYPSSIWDESLYKAWSEIVTNLIPNIRLLETHLNNFCRMCDADEVVLFERATFLVISHAQLYGGGDDDNYGSGGGVISGTSIGIGAGGGGGIAGGDNNNNNNTTGNDYPPITTTAGGSTILPDGSAAAAAVTAASSPPTDAVDIPASSMASSPMSPDDSTNNSGMGGAGAGESAPETTVSGDGAAAAAVGGENMAIISANAGGGTTTDHPQDGTIEETPRHLGRTPHFDSHRFEKISNIVKQFKLSCGKAQSQFQGMEVRNSRFSAFIDAFTANTYIMVIVSNPHVHTAATLLNIQNARNHFERFIPRI